MEREEEVKGIGGSRKTSNLEKSSVLRGYMDDTSNNDQPFSA